MYIIPTQNQNSLNEKNPVVKQRDFLKRGIDLLSHP